jgi:N-acetylmuramoyl-L-alanine amidase
MRFKVVMTRTSDRFLTLQQRVDLANRVRENAVFVSIHFNSGRSGARGIETFTLSPPGVAHYGRGKIAADALSRPGNVHDAANVALATAVHGMCLVGLGRQNTFDRGIKRARFTVLTGVRHPAILLEGGFMSHPQEARLINTPAYRQQLARAVAAGIRRYCGAVSQPPPAGTKK